jgi:hypothetical protein
MLDFGKESFLVGLNNGTFLEDWRTCFVLVVRLCGWGRA